MSNKFKIFLITITILLASGCSIKYNLVIDKNGATENINAEFANNESNRKLVDKLYKQERSAYYDFDNGKTYYYEVKRLDDTRKTIGLNYRYNYYKHEKLQYSNALTQCFYNVSVVKDKEFITINTSKGINCLSHDGQKLVNKIDVSIRTDYKVVENNADEHSNNNYMWYINGKNSNNKSIYIKIDYKEKAVSMSNEDKILLIVIAAIIVVAFISLILYTSHRNKKYGYK